MNKKNPSSKESSNLKKPLKFSSNELGKKNKSQAEATSGNPNQEVLIKVGGFEYRTPGRRQRIIIGSIVIGLNLVLVIAVAVYFYNPAFQEFIYNVGRS